MCRGWFATPPISMASLTIAIRFLVTTGMYALWLELAFSVASWLFSTKPSTCRPWLLKSWGHVDSRRAKDRRRVAPLLTQFRPPSLSLPCFLSLCALFLGFNTNPARRVNLSIARSCGIQANGPCIRGEAKLEAKPFLVIGGRLVRSLPSAQHPDVSYYYLQEGAASEGDVETLCVVFVWVCVFCLDLALVGDVGTAKAHYPLLCLIYFRSIRILHMLSFTHLCLVVSIVVCMALVCLLITVAQGGHPKVLPDIALAWRPSLSGCHGSMQALACAGACASAVCTATASCVSVDTANWDWCGLLCSKQLFVPTMPTLVLSNCTRPGDFAIRGSSNHAG